MTHSLEQRHAITPELEAARLEVWAAKANQRYARSNGSRRRKLGNQLADAAQKLSRLRALILVRNDRG